MDVDDKIYVKLTIAQFWSILFGVAIGVFVITGIYFRFVGMEKDKEILEMKHLEFQKEIRTELSNMRRNTIRGDSALHGRMTRIKSDLVKRIDKIK